MALVCVMGDFSAVELEKMVLLDGMGDACRMPRRTAAERRARPKWANESAHRAIRKHPDELQRSRSQLKKMQASLPEFFGNGELWDRPLAIVPASPFWPSRPHSTWTC
ncbi:unnamed protein product [Prorocentrum cordatum]|uniref:Uncharacterized protein n=1 Tax=Prorocentrum cordatum TaxID=2364126 RepID=A0ABN9QDE1_9DINO|nr:unnamed protein product [Polarella glacialis]